MEETGDAAGLSGRQSSARLIASSLTLATTGIFPVFLAGALAVQMSREFGYGPRGIGLSIAGFYVVSTVSSITLGRLADRVGWGRAIRTGAFGSIAGLVAIGSLANSLASVVLLIAVAGMANAQLQPAINLLLARQAPIASRGLIFGLKQAAIPLATLIGGVSVPLLALTVGWRWVFAAAAGFGVVALTILPRTSDSTARSGGGPPRDRGSFRALTPMVVIALLGQTGASVLGSFVVVSAVFAGMDEGHAGLLLAAASVAGIIARVFLGIGADRGLRLDLLPIAALLLLGGMGLALVAIPSTWAAVTGTFVGFVAGWGWPGLFNLLVVTRFERVPATATSATQIGVYVGNGLGPLLFGLAAASSYAAAWMLSAGFLVAAAGVAFRSHIVDKAASTA